LALEDAYFFRGEKGLSTSSPGVFVLLGRALEGKRVLGTEEEWRLELLRNGLLHPVCSSRRDENHWPEERAETYEKHD